MSIEQPRHLSYLLHLRQVKRGGELVWWASLENPLTGERQAFADLAELFAFLDQKMGKWYLLTAEKELAPCSETATRMTQPVSQPGSLYLSYLIRLVRVDREGQPNWRVSLQSPNTSDQSNFIDLEALMKFLEEKLGEIE